MKRIIEYILAVLLLGVLIFFAWGKIAAVFCNKGNYYYERAEYNKALEFYNKSLRMDPKAWIARLGLAETYNIMGDYDAAVKEYKNLLGVKGARLRAIDALVYIYTKQGMYEEAFNLTKQVGDNSANIQSINSSLCSFYVNDALNRSSLLFSEQESGKAVNILEDALEKCPGSPVAYYTLGLFYYSLKDYQNSEMYLNKALEMDADYWQAYKLLSSLYFAQGKLENSVSSGKKALSINKDDPALYNDVGIALMNLEQYGEAVDFLEQAVSFEPVKEDYIYNLASVYRDNKMLDKALEEYSRLNNMNPQYPYLHNDLGDIYRNLGKESLALSEFQKEIEFAQLRLKGDNNNPVFLNGYAYALAQTGKYSLAQEIIEKVLTVYPRYRLAHLTLAKIYSNSGRQDLALEELRKAKQLSVKSDFIDIDISRIQNKNTALNKNGSAYLDTVYLKNGRRLQGRIVKEEKDRLFLEVWLGSTTGEVIFYRNAIDRIERG